MQEATIQPHRPNSDRAVADQIRPAEPVRCDGCNSVWQPGRRWFGRESRPAWGWCERCRRRNEEEALDWRELTEAEIRELAGGGEPITEPEMRGGRDDINKRMAEQLRKWGESMDPRSRELKKIKPRGEQDDMPTGQYERKPMTPEQREAKAARFRETMAKKKGDMTPERRARISEAMKASHAKRRAERLDQAMRLERTDEIEEPMIPDTPRTKRMRADHRTDEEKRKARETLAEHAGLSEASVDQEQEDAEAMREPAAEQMQAEELEVVIRGTDVQLIQSGSRETAAIRSILQAVHALRALDPETRQLAVELAEG